MTAFLKRHWRVHIWLLGVLALFGVYWYGISSRQAANSVSAVAQTLKDGYAQFWYLFPFSVVEWLYVAFIVELLLGLRRCSTDSGPGRENVWKPLMAGCWD